MTPQAAAYAKDIGPKIAKTHQSKRVPEAEANGEGEGVAKSKSKTKTKTKTPRDVVLK